MQINSSLQSTVPQCHDCLYFQSVTTTCLKGSYYFLDSIGSKHYYRESCYTTREDKTKCGIEGRWYKKAPIVIKIGRFIKNAIWPS